MKGFMAGIVVTAPIMAIVMFLFLGQTQQINTKQDRVRTDTQIDSLQFDQDFSKAWENMGGGQLDSKENKKERKKRIEKLQEKRQAQAKEEKELDKKSDRVFQKFQEGMQEAGENPDQVQWPSAPGGGGSNNQSGGGWPATPGGGGQGGQK